MIPAALNREQAAEYVGVSPNSFDKLVRGQPVLAEPADGREQWEFLPEKDAE